jgi:hypothetical protein
LILRNSDSSPCQVLRLRDIGLGIDIHGLLSEEARRKNWQSDERRIGLMQRQDVRRQRHLRNIKFFESELAEKATKRGF